MNVFDAALCSLLRDDFEKNIWPTSIRLHPNSMASMFTGKFKARKNVNQISSINMYLAPIGGEVRLIRDKRVSQFEIKVVYAKKRR